MRRNNQTSDTAVILVSILLLAGSALLTYSPQGLATPSSNAISEGKSAPILERITRQVTPAPGLGSDPQLSGDAHAIAALFDKVMNEQTLAITSDSAEEGTTKKKLSEFLQENPHTMENLFSAVLFDCVNHAGETGPDAAFEPLFSEDPLSVFELDEALNLFTQSYNNRAYAYVDSTSVGLGSVLDTPYSPNAEYSQEFIISELLFTSPIVLDLDADGVLQASEGRWLPHPGNWSETLRLFDINADGMVELIEWVGPNDGLLVQHYIEGRVALNGSNLFGDMDGYLSGFQKLAQYDFDINGVIEGEELNGLSVWQDSNQDALVDEGEIHNLEALTITSISLDHNEFQGSYQTAEGTQVLWDWYPNVLSGYLKTTLGPEIHEYPHVDPMQAMVSIQDQHFKPFSLTAAQSDELLNGSRLATVTDSGKILLTMRNRSEVQLSSYDGMPPGMLLAQVFSDSEGSIQVEIIQLPYVTEVQAVFPVEGQDGVIIIANSGTRILDVNLDNGHVHVMWMADAWEFPTLIPGNMGDVVDNVLYCAGYELMSDRSFAREVLISIPLDGGDMAPVRDLNELLGEYANGPTGCSTLGWDNIYCARNSGDGIEISTNSPTNTLVAIDDAGIFHGMWAGHSHLLYLVDNDNETDIDPDLAARTGVSVRLYDSIDIGSTIIAEGPYSSPVMSPGAETIAVATHDYVNQKIRYFIGTHDNGYQLCPAFTDMAIGPLRISRDGANLAYQSADGIYMRYTGDVAPPVTTSSSDTISSGATTSTAGKSDVTDTNSMNEKLSDVESSDSFGNLLPGYTLTSCVVIVLVVTGIRPLRSRRKPKE